MTRHFRRGAGRLTMLILVLAAAVLMVQMAATPAKAAQDSRITAAINWGLAERYDAKQPYNGNCLAFVNDAYVKGAGITLTKQGLGSAPAAADYFKAAANAEPPTPRGAWVFFRNGANGHVGLSLGDGTMVHNPGWGVIVSSEKMNLPYIGWAYPQANPPLGDTTDPPVPAGSGTVAPNSPGFTKGGTPSYWKASGLGVYGTGLCYTGGWAIDNCGYRTSRPTTV